MSIRQFPIEKEQENGEPWEIIKSLKNELKQAVEDLNKANKEILKKQEESARIEKLLQTALNSTQDKEDIKDSYYSLILSSISTTP